MCENEMKNKTNAECQECCKCCENCKNYESEEVSASDYIVSFIFLILGFLAGLILSSTLLFIGFSDSMDIAIFIGIIFSCVTVIIARVLFECITTYIKEIKKSETYSKE